jgi:hypothetical protein
MRPQYREKNPIRRTKYRIRWIPFNIEPLANSFKQSTTPKESSKVPWKTSPNITPNRKGKVTMAKIAGFISLY